MAADFNLLKLVVTIRLETDITDPLALFGIRGDFQVAFLQTLNCGKAACEGCRSGYDCPAYHAFAQAITTDPAALKRYQKPPLPFIFDFPVLPSLPNKGACIECGLTLVGSAINYLDFYLTALSVLFRSWGQRRRYSCTVLKAESCDYHDGRSLIMERNSGILSSNLHLLSALELLQTRTISSEKLTLSFLTPLRIMQDGRPLRQMSFSPLLRTLLRRVSSLAYYFGVGELELEYKWLVEQSLLVDCRLDECQWGAPGQCIGNERFSGLVGSAVFTGALAEFHLPLLIGEFVHLGKGASFGLGRYQIRC
jgi:hypothetical protein